MGIKSLPTIPHRRPIRFERLEARRLLAAADLDTSFDVDGFVQTGFTNWHPDDSGRSVAVQADGKILVAGYTYQTSENGFAVARFNIDSTLDTSFNGQGLVITGLPNDEVPDDDFAYDLAIQTDGKIIVVGTSHRDFAVVRYLADGSRDNTFGSSGKIETPVGTDIDEAYGVAIQSDGKIVVAGFRRAAGNDDFAVVRYKTDGTLDTTFDGDGRVTTAIGSGNDYARSVAIQSDGKIVVAGYSHNGTNHDFAIVRYNPNGSLDASFDGDGKRTDNFGSGVDEARDVILQSDGKIVVAGHTDSGGTNDDFALARYNANGTLDTTFDGDGKQTTDLNLDDVGHSVAVQSDGRIVVSGSTIGNGVSTSVFGLARYNVDGTLDTAFSGDGKQTTTFNQSPHVAYGVAVQADGKIVAAGQIGSGAVDFGVARYNADGSPDASFDGDGRVAIDFPSAASTDEIHGITIQTDGKIVAAGSSNDGDSVDFALARYNPDGSLDSSFGADGRVITDMFGPANDVVLQPDGKIIAVGGNGNFLAARYNVDGSLDSSFSGDGMLFASFGSYGYANAVALLPDGKILMAGFTRVGGQLDFGIIRLNANGTFDTSFDGDGRVSTPIGSSNDEASALAIQPDGKIVLVGRSRITSFDYDYSVARYNADGSLDTSFDGDGMLMIPVSSGYDEGASVTIQPDGKIILAGTASSTFGVVRLNSDGSFDSSFSDDGTVLVSFGGTTNVSDVELQSNGKILVAAGVSAPVLDHFSLARFNADGSLDPSFSGDGKLMTVFNSPSDLYDIAIQADGKIVAAGSSEWDFGLIRYAGDSLPGDFNVDGVVNTADYTIWRDTLGRSVTQYSGADGDGDGTVDPDDYQVWKDHFGESLPGNGGTTHAEALAGAASIDGLILVTTLEDETNLDNGLTSLREAIFAANIVGGPNTIQFADSLCAAGPATILLTLGELLITDALVIDGPGAELLTIDASGNDADPETTGDGSRVFHVNDSLSSTSLDVQIEGLTLTGGDVADSGGAILSRENLYAVNLQIVGNSAGAGGAITLSGYTASSTVVDCFIANNHATVDGGAIFLQATGPGATSFIVGNTITGNSARRGGAIFVGLSAPGAVLDLFDNEITNNTSEFQGGAIYVLSQSTPKTTIRSSTISGNTAGTKGGGIYVNLARDLSIIDSTISNNRSLSAVRELGRGGGIYSASGELSIVGSTISGNIGTSGGGIYSRNGDLAIDFSTIANNQATAGDGGGVDSFQDRLSIVGSTISGNTAFGTGSLGGGQILGRGGGLAHTAGPVTPTTILDTNFIANTSNTSGGGAFFRSNFDGGNASISLTNTSFSTNSSKVGGGVMLGDGGNFLGTLVMDDGVISGNHATTHGGGVYGVAYSVLVNGTTITGNRAEGNGGGWSAFGAAGRSGVRNLAFVGAHITENSAGGSDSPTNSGLGGGIHIPLGFVFVSLFDSEVSRNSARDGGGIARGGPVVASGLLSVKVSTISGNSAFRHGGGIYNVGGSISVTRSTIANNRSTPAPGAAFGNGGGIFARQSDVSLVESTLSGNSVANGRGGGLYLGQTGDLTVTASTIVGNSANQDGGGVWDGASQERVLIQSSTVSGNSSAAGTGGLYLRGHLSIRNSTVTKNVGGGTRPGGVLAGDGAQQLEFDHSIVAGNLHKSFGPPDLLFFTNASNVTVRSSLIGDNTQSKLVEAPLGSPDANGNLIGQPISAGGQGAIDPVLGPLAPNGGRTLTHALLPGSPALDGGALITGTPHGYDQRGNPFRRMFDGTGDGVVRIDMGAYESQGVPSFTVGDFNRDGLVDVCDFVIFRDQLGRQVEPFSQSDADGNGIVDYDDYELWKANFGKGLTFTTGLGGSASFALDDESIVELPKTAGGPLATSPPIVVTSPTSARSRTASSRPASVSASRWRDDALLVYLASRADLAADGNATDAFPVDEKVDESVDFELALDVAFGTL